jgi:AMP-polyphosphate phosphotransferase
MFESAELGHQVDDETFDREEPLLRTQLLDVQHDVIAAKRFPVIVLINGMDGAGRGETIHVLNEWLDPRYVETHAFDVPTEEERERPFMWRFWRALPPKGKVGILFGSWYSEVIHQRMASTRQHDEEADLRSAEINRFEKMLTDEGALVLKFWFHLSKSDQKKRLKTLEADPKTRWRVTREDWKRYEQYDDFRSVAEHVLRFTSKSYAPWYIVDGSDAHFRSLTIGNILLEAMQKRLARPDGSRRIAEAPIYHSRLDSRSLLSTLDLGKKVTSKKKYEEELLHWQERLGQLSRSEAFRSKSLVLVFEGNDAAGKGGSIRRVVQAIDPRQFKVAPIAAPTEEERAQPYLWRFWRHMPRLGRATIFDRSWYGRVLVERVESFAEESDWMRAYAEINDFEDQLALHGTIVVKFWLAISKDEQLRRFEEREATDFKRFKITEEDWRNREKWEIYEQAVCDMVDRTSTEIAPWTLVEANDKRYARLKVLKTVCKRLEDSLEKPAK